ncbi:related to rAsp f 9 allergen [Ramularia collo-cygni]|uniref:Crh-like protein n=1 Tax=Ramularia collo-cygni TaxID=112498 RepID=A0A2D3URF4_9PEZI|nr:related to rAsp f 9 allergen [Ramularia collo-cygni]CZT17118.1 related to rAsp f 9 allergen [Ramularia collo-cygni]
MRLVTIEAGVLLACLSSCMAQTSTDCNPTNETCSSDVGLSSSTYSADFTKPGNNASWTAAAYSEITYGDEGAVFTISKEGQAPTMETDFYFLFGKVEVTMKAAPGTGIVSSIVLESDDLDEIDWEFLGGDTTQVQSNFFGKGNTTSYDRALYSAIKDPQNTWHTYTIDWNEETLKYLIDGSEIRTVKYSEPSTVFGKNYPQTPMRLKLGNWAGGAKGNSPGTIEWAGGEVDFEKGPFTMYVKSVSISNANPACSYSYKDKTGDFSSIDIVTTGDSCSANSTSPDTTANSTSTATQAPTSSHSVAHVEQTEAVVATTVTGSAYSTNSASASALNGGIVSTTALPTGGSTTAGGPASSSSSESFTGDASSVRAATVGAGLGMLVGLWVL